MAEPASVLETIPPLLIYFAVGLCGALWGSFLNVCIYRIGLYESVVWPASRCSSCGNSIVPQDNIPMLSWLWLRGRCRFCKSPISIRYPLVEALTTVLALALYFKLSGHFSGLILLGHFLVYFTFLCVVIVLSGIDFDHKLLPDRITLSWLPVFFVASVFFRDFSLAELLIGVILGYAMIAITIRLSALFLGREGMGYGDAKLLALIGALLGWRGVVAAFFFAPFVGLLVVIPVLSLRRSRILGVEIPYGPFLVIGALAYIFFGSFLPQPLTNRF